ncbi:MAG: type VII secretion target [Actinomycetota bacterium]|nr:type VII secretion target [Actinomycetota bacterium]
MSGQIAVIPQDLRRSASNIESAAGDVAKADPSSRIKAISSAMRGSASARQVGELEYRLQWRFENWPKKARTYSDALTKAAREYEASDHGAEARGRQSEQQVNSVG